MATAGQKGLAFDNLAELMERLGNVPLDRIRMHPPPGTATEKDVLAALREPRKRLCELIDGVLVEKAMAVRESLLAAALIHLLADFVQQNDLGVVLGADGMIRLFPGQVRIPDVSFIAWGRLPGEEVPDEAIGSVVPNLTVEVLSRGNTRPEMKRKLREYFLAGVELVWVIAPKTQTAEMYTAPDECRQVGKGGSLDGGDVLPGFRASLKELFARLARRRSRR
jgi:Uma2 family endonuclease